MMNLKSVNKLISLLLSIILLVGCSAQGKDFFDDLDITAQSTTSQFFTIDNVPEYDGNAYVKINDNVPQFSDEQKSSTKSYEEYGALDSLKRCTYAISCIGKDLMPTKERGAIGSVKPTGWQIAKYDFVDGKYLYNRCHLIGYQLTGENANECNLITGTRYLNVDGMLPFENDIADYINITDNHVLYEVVPVFEGDNLVASGVHMQAYSVEDEGKGISFNIYCYNVQPGVIIDYSTGANKLDESQNEYTTTTQADNETYIVNINTKKFHKPNCDSAKKTSAKNKKTYKGSRESLISNGYSPCQKCGA